VTRARVGRFAAVAFAAAFAMALLSSTAFATFPGANGLIAFARDIGGGKSEIATMKPDGSHVRSLTRGNAPAWSADGKRIVFMRIALDRPRSDLYVMRADGSHVRRLTFTPHRWEAGPAFSPNGRKVVFDRLGVGIIVMRLDNLRTRFVTESGIAPQWAPNGRRIVFVDQSDNSVSRIATIRPDGTHERGLTSPPEFPGMDAYPAYAANGRTIYFDRFPRHGPVALMKVGAFGGHLQRVTTPTSVGGLYSPAPAPAGGCVVGAGTRGEVAELYARGQRCPVPGWLNQQGAQPSWQPLPAAK
jgi:Tol biopolymer transport system component